MTDNPQYDEARKRVKALKGFYTNLFFYVIVNIFLLIINLITSPVIYGFSG